VDYKRTQNVSDGHTTSIFIVIFYSEDETWFFTVKLEPAIQSTLNNNLEDDNKKMSTYGKYSFKHSVTILSSETLSKAEFTTW
jgi:hypothetical protein